MKTIEEIRLENLTELRRGFSSERQFAIKLNKQPNQVNQWFGKGSARSIQSESAREVEGILGKPYGWLDNDHSRSLRPNTAIILRGIQLLREATHKTEGEAIDVEADPELFAEMLKLAIIEATEKEDGERGVRASGGQGGGAVSAASQAKDGLAEGAAGGERAERAAATSAGRKRRATRAS